MISVPPWRKDVKHDEVKKQLVQWSLTSSDFKSASNGVNLLKFIDMIDMAGDGAGGSIFTALLSDDLAKIIQDDFTLGGFKVIVHPSRNYRLPDLRTRRLRSPGGLHPMFPPTGSHPATWAAATVVPSLLSSSNQRTPVLYVVDGGVQPIVPGVTSGTRWHPEFAAATNGDLKLRQGRLSDQALSRSWQHPLDQWYPLSPTPMTPWNYGADTHLTWTGQPKLLATTAYSASKYLDPHRDQKKHGTLVMSCAIGANVGVVGRVENVKTDFQSMRVYPSGNNPSASTAGMVEGIYNAVDAHLARGQGAASVLMFASRTTDGYDQSLENALWWAWKQGLICIVSAGNEPDPYDTGKHEPDSQWFPSATVPQPNSPSRIEWETGNTPAGEAFWESLGYKSPNGDPIPVPDTSYLIVVGANNAVKTATSPPPSIGDGWAASASKGPDVDVLAPSMSVPCANTTTGGLLTASGASMSTGYVAGVALAYLSHVSAAQANPDAFREWLLPTSVPGSTSPIKLSTTASSWPGHLLPNSYGGQMPVIELKALP